ncbi:hypothetical protein VOLCADRAFT_116089 [Volvox carteri f. nagariensis]|uniref:Mur ligase central domain-containing protein n=1 Tax=Volvox carteri f. nagariensis TaxID=3068 RepID=D8TKK2_VOLCA|nr:uncharacterized protein VOLCADRAFT_116089 [Volvox carteri f. nagariensis]EFJ52076.1 hypothetical protein VOLCADRAFT_116089 [Volvox carteri f. nagariensis]|eukprot:XP_002946850.1 hypothetical protein VOLCADRAFT_116089 [Volvox carteri f. nagariensis]
MHLPRVPRSKHEEKSAACARMIRCTTCSRSCGGLRCSVQEHPRHSGTTWPSSSTSPAVNWQQPRHLLNQPHAAAVSESLEQESSGAAGAAAANLLDSLVNYERSGIPPAAGTAGSSRFDLGRMHRLLAALGNPHMGLKAVHVAGSKGKGSTVTLLAHILAAAGYRTGVYTSPHLLALEERIAVAHPGAVSRRPRPLPPDDLAFLIDRHGGAIRSTVAAEGGALSHFEVLTALAFRYFADCSVDVAVLETGLGGATDATNVVPGANLQAAVITALGMEHVEALGGSLRSIAAAKAGILRPGRPLVLGRQLYAEAEEVVLTEAEAKACSPVVRAQSLVSVRSHGIEIQLDRCGQIARERLSLELLSEPDLYGTSFGTMTNRSSGGSSRYLEATVGLVGAHQHDNVATAVAAVRVLQREGGWRLDDEAVVEGLREAQLPGRFQVVKLPGPEGPYVVLDGAHTAESAAALTASLRAAFPGPTTPLQTQPAGSGTDIGPVGHPVALVLAMADDKDHRGTVTALRAVQPRVAVFTSVPIAGSYHRAAAPGTLAGHWQAAAILAASAPSPASPSSSDVSPTTPQHRQYRPFRCRELVQASLAAAFDKARQELRGVRASLGLAPGVGSPGVILVTGSLHAVAAAYKIPELQPLLQMGP